MSVWRSHCGGGKGEQQQQGGKTTHAARVSARAAADKLRVFELDYKKAQGEGAIAEDDDLVKQLDAMTRPGANGSTS